MYKVDYFPLSLKALWSALREKQPAAPKRYSNVYAQKSNCCKMAEDVWKMNDNELTWID